MNHWTSTYIGRKYDKRTFNCAHLVEAVGREVVGVDVTVPDETEWRGTEPRRIAELGIEYAFKVAEPKEHDIVLMRLLGSKRSLGSHIGIWTFRGCPFVLHNLSTTGVILTTEYHLVRLALEVVGYYRWKRGNPPASLRGSHEGAVG